MNTELKTLKNSYLSEQINCQKLHKKNLALTSTDPLHLSHAHHVVHEPAPLAHPTHD
jgi:hypothetical protein